MAALRPNMRPVVEFAPQTGASSGRYREPALGKHIKPADSRFPLPQPRLELSSAGCYATHRFHLHFTPTGGSRLNLGERWFALLTEQPRRGIHRGTYELKVAIRAYLEYHNRPPKPFIWTKPVDAKCFSTS